MGRFIVYTSMAFITAFVGVFWAMRGFPMWLPAPASSRPLQPTLDVVFGDNSSEKKREQLVLQQLENPDNAKRNTLRADALQAATGYALSPCDTTMKDNLVAAMRVYAAADHEIRKCNVILGTCDAAFERATAVYSTPADLRVREALHEAFEKGGISRTDFPSELQMSVMVLANSQGSPVSQCETSADRGCR
jgi:hypothetical protein